MSTDVWEEARRVYFELFEASDAERAARLAKCGADVRAEVESLLRADRDAGSFLERAPSEGLPLGARCGAYRILEVAGRGGMGIVYRGCRDDGQYQQDVAIKLMTDSLVSRDSARRFATEQQVLAGLRHPNIVRLLDGGIVGDRQYLVMEFVRGQPLGEWTRVAGRTDTQILEAFSTICRAVHYAHQNLVIHRDLKPGNVLVQDDGEPKLLDFGIAKAIDPVAPDLTAALGQRLTLAYASPEQVKGLAVTLASDVYSLGTLLYEMLDGQPAQAVTGKTLDAAIATICESPPRRLSRRAHRRQVDLDSIVAKAMHKDPSGRYASARELAEDVDRYRQGRAVLARDATLRYVLARAVARHRTATVVAAAVVILLALAASLTVRQAHIAEREATLAESRFQTAQKLARVLIVDAQRDLGNVPGALEARRMLVRKGLEYLEALSKDAAGDVALRRDIAFAYGQVSQVQWNQNIAHLGDAPGAAQSLTSALALWRQLFAESPSLAHAQGLVFALNGLGSLREVAGDKDEQMRLAREAVGVAERFEHASQSDPAALLLLANTRFSMALAVRLSDHPGRIQAWAEALPVYHRLLSLKPTDSDSMRNVALVEKYLAGVLHNAGRSREGLPHAERALALDEKRGALMAGNRQTMLDLAIDYSQLGSMHSALGDTAKGVELLRESLQIRRQLAEADPKDMRVKDRLGFALQELGHRLIDHGQPEAAMPYLRESVGILKTLPPSANVDLMLGTAYHDIGSILFSSRRKGEACVVLEPGRGTAEGGAGGPARSEAASQRPRGRAGVRRSR